MRLKFPKKITIGDQSFEIKYDKKRIGGEFYYWEENKNKKTIGGRITIGTKLLKVSPSEVLSTIIHELKEMINEEQGVRYQTPNSKDTCEFHYNHTQHNDMCSRLTGLLDLFIQ